MRWLIDGYNVIRRDPDLQAHESAGLHAGRAALLALLARIAARLSPTTCCGAWPRRCARAPSS